jgi:3-hydroxyisobutyrate dehydrogenase-like beta-hydroxyacid dehydrogenase
VPHSSRMSERRIAWIGLGLIGLPMAGRLAAAGWRVSGFDLNAERMALAKARGVLPAADHAQATKGAPLVFTSLPSETALLQFVAGAEALGTGAILVETSTVGPHASAQVADSLRSRGVAYLRAPISGSTALAEAGTLTAFVSGPRDAFERARDALKAYSRAQLWLGEGEQARYAKLAVNLMVAGTAGMMGEALALGRKGGIGWAQLLELMGESVAGSPLVKYKLEPLRRRDFTPAATGALLVKDLELIVAAAAQAGVPVPLAGQVLASYRAMTPAELASEDFFSIVRAIERAAGLGEPS